MATIDDAYRKIKSAKLHIRNLHYADAIFDAHLSIELSLKSLLKKMDIKYPPTHDLDIKIFDKFFNNVNKIDIDDIKSIKRKLSQAILFMKIGSKIRNYTEYGIFNISADDIFSEEGLQELSKLFVKYSEVIYFDISNILEKIAKKRGEKL